MTHDPDTRQVAVVSDLGTEAALLCAIFHAYNGATNLGALLALATTTTRFEIVSDKKIDVHKSRRVDN